MVFLCDQQQEKKAFQCDKKKRIKNQSTFQQSTYLKGSLEYDEQIRYHNAQMNHARNQYVNSLQKNDNKDAQQIQKLQEMLTFYDNLFFKNILKYQAQIDQYIKKDQSNQKQLNQTKRQLQIQKNKNKQLQNTINLNKTIIQSLMITIQERGIQINKLKKKKTLKEKLQIPRQKKFEKQFQNSNKKIDQKEEFVCRQKIQRQRNSIQHQSFGNFSAIKSKRLTQSAFIQEINKIQQNLVQLKKKVPLINKDLSQGGSLRNQYIQFGENESFIDSQRINKNQNDKQNLVTLSKQSQ